MYNIVFPDLEQIYSALADGSPLPPQPSGASFCGWAALEQSAAYAEERRSEWHQQLAFWRTALRDVKPRVALEHLCGALRPPQPLAGSNVAQGEHIKFELAADLAEQLRSTACEHGVSLFALLAWATSSLLSRWTHQRSVTLLTVADQRGSPATADLAGFLLNSIVLPFVHGDETLRAALRRFNQVCTSAIRHSEVPFAKVAADAAPPGFAADINVAIVLEPSMADVSEGPGGTRGWTWTQRAVTTDVAKFDLKLEFDDRGSGQDTLCRVEYRTSALTASAAEAFVGALRTFLASLAAAESDVGVKAVGCCKAEPVAFIGRTVPLSVEVPISLSLEAVCSVGLWVSAECPLPARAPVILAAAASSAEIRLVSPSASLSDAVAQLRDCKVVYADEAHVPAAQLAAPPQAQVMALPSSGDSVPPPEAVNVVLSDSSIERSVLEFVAHLSEQMGVLHGPGHAVLLAGAEMESTLERQVVLAAAACGWQLLASLPGGDIVEFTIIGSLDGVEAAATKAHQVGTPATNLVVVNESHVQPVLPARLLALESRVVRGGQVLLVTHLTFSDGQLFAAVEASDIAPLTRSALGTVTGEPVQQVSLQDSAGALSLTGTTGRLFVDGVDSGLLATRTTWGDFILVHPGLTAAQVTPEASTSTTEVSATAPVAAPAMSNDSMEKTLCSLMASALGMASFGPDDDFYALGGDSMSAIQLVSAASAKGLTLRVSMIARLRTPKALAKAVGPAVSVERSPPAGVRAPSPTSQGPGGASSSAVLCSLMAEALSMSSFGAEDDFYALGGDSMSAIQLVSAASAKGLTLRVSMIARLRTPLAIAAALDQQQPDLRSNSSAALVTVSAPSAPASASVEEGIFPASAIHHWLSTLRLSNEGHNDQSFVLRFAADQHLPVVSKTWLVRALEVLIAHHDSLRMRTQWANEEEVPKIRIARVGSGETRPAVFAESEVDGGRLLLHEVLDPVRGPTVAAAVMDDGLAVWLAVHHIAVDIYSWKLLVTDLSQAYEAVAERGGAAWDSAKHPQELAAAVLAARTAGPGAWALAQHSYANSAAAASHTASWVAALQGATAPVLPEGLVTPRNGATERAEVRLAAPMLAQLKERVVGASSGAVSMLAVTLAALASALANDEETVVWLEGHGRDGEAFLGDAAPNASRTVGWYTAMFPFALAPATGGAAAQQKQHESVLHGGTSFGVLRHLSTSDHIRNTLVAAAKGPPAVLFNFAGMGLAGDRSVDSPERFSMTTAYAGPFGSDANLGLAPLVVNCIVNADQELVTTFDFGIAGNVDDDQGVRDRVAAMADAFAASLQQQALRAGGDARGGRRSLRAALASSSEARVKRQTSLSPAPSAELLIHLHDAQGDAADQAPLFLIHPAGGQAAAYTVLVDAMAETLADSRGPLPVPVFGIEMTPFRMGQETLESVAAQYVGVMRAQHPTGPWMVGGWSLGGLIAHEVARQLEAAGGRVLLVVHLDSHHPALDQRFRDFCRGLVKSEEALLALLWRHVELVADQRAVRISASTGNVNVPDRPPFNLTYEEVLRWPRGERRARFVALVVEQGLLPLAAAQAFVPRFLQTFYEAVELILACKEMPRQPDGSLQKVQAPALFVRATEVTSAPFEGFTCIEEDLETSRAKGDLVYGWQQVYAQEMKVELVAGSHETFAFDPYAQDVAKVVVGHLHDALR